jgi:hypothetical protein
MEPTLKDELEKLAHCIACNISWLTLRDFIWEHQVYSTNITSVKIWKKERIPSETCKCFPGIRVLDRYCAGNKATGGTLYFVKTKTSQSFPLRDENGILVACVSFHNTIFKMSFFLTSNRPVSHGPPDEILCIFERMYHWFRTNAIKISLQLNDWLSWTRMLHNSMSKKGWIFPPMKTDVHQRRPRWQVAVFEGKESTLRSI